MFSCIFLQYLVIKTLDPAPDPDPDPQHWFNELTEFLPYLRQLGRGDNTLHANAYNTVHVIFETL